MYHLRPDGVNVVPLARQQLGLERCGGWGGLRLLVPRHGADEEPPLPQELPADRGAVVAAQVRPGSGRLKVLGGWMNGWVG